jgi:hypothetical protein
MTMEPIRTEYTISESDFVTVCSRLQVQAFKSKPWLIALFILFPIWICYILSDSIFPTWAVLLMVILSSAFMVFSFVRRMKKIAITAYRTNFRNQEAIRFSADEAGVLQEGGSYRTNTGWEQITRVELAQGFYLLYIGPGRAQPVPAASFSLNDRERFESLLDRHKPGWRK